jgi:hypothetical protein
VVTHLGNELHPVRDILSASGNVFLDAIILEDGLRVLEKMEVTRRSINAQRSAEIAVDVEVLPS